MRKTILYSAIFLLITSTLFVTAAATKPQPETYTVTFETSEGDNGIAGTVELSCRERGNTLDLYGKVEDEDLDLVGNIWKYDTLDWRAVSHTGNLRIYFNKVTNEVMDLIYDFDPQPFDDSGKKYPKYHLRGPTADGYDISEIVVSRKGKKGALSIEYIYITTLELEFTVTAEKT